MAGPSAYSGTTRTRTRNSTQIRNLNIILYHEMSDSVVVVVVVVVVAFQEL